MGEFKFRPTSFVIPDGRTYGGLDPSAPMLAKEAEGLVLEIGFGVGATHRALHANPAVQAIAVVELHQEVLDHYKQCGCAALVVDWTNLKPTKRGWDTVVYDVALVEDQAELDRLLEFVKPGGLVIWRGGTVRRADGL